MTYRCNKSEPKDCSLVDLLLETIILLYPSNKEVEQVINTLNTDTMIGSFICSEINQLYEVVFNKEIYL